MSSEIEHMDCSQDDFYKNAQEYWAEIPPTVDGMLGGFSSISEKDIKGSKLLLRQLFRLNKPPGNKYALDCGAGIGRVTKHLLIDLFENVDLVEQNSNFIAKAKAYIGTEGTGRLCNLYSTGLQSFKPDPGKYDVIWMQWVLGHLTDSDLVECFNNCKAALKPDGVIIVKENITSSGTIEMDKNDSSFTRPISLLKKLFDEAGLNCFKQHKQHDFPKCLYPVYMFVLRPKSEGLDKDETEPPNKVIRNNEVEELVCLTSKSGSSEVGSKENGQPHESENN
ncbi:N-terminal Xaa-Pro-Lys N-methyltransferase 1 [Coccinella septempunctata]|uniref:N-terminal Xaa-Pro-Lys N-methyltransferase 1 n=1 Tax=Coccinella septempunctata TaxID=41139 RepID=UPI001D05FC3B|nr:N-terminal Xaa-Pro-Lys N-methyltransferase 1 [Coccinella septempunctata]